MSRLIRRLAPIAPPAFAVLQDLLLVILRIWMLRVFFLSGLQKINSWDTTILLFENDYDVPLLPPDIAAYLATAAELGLPLLLVVGLGGRFAAAGLFILNIVAATSYPDISDVGLKDHYYWGALLAVLAIFGPGRAALDTFVLRFFKKRYGLN